MKADLHPREFLRHGLQVLLFNTFLWALQMGSGIERWGRWDNTLVYTQAIGMSIWAICDFGRIALLRPGDLHWPSPPRALLLIALAVVGGFTIGSLVGDWYSDAPLFSFAQRPLVHLRSAILFTIVASSIATYFFYARGRAAVQRERIAEAERDAMLARLQLLQSQLEPHMLFNTLANLRVLIVLDPPRAQAMLDRLIAFLRATLGASRSRSHSLEAECERLRDYLALMSIRMGERLSTEFDIPTGLAQVPVPPLLLQPLVENSIRHGLEPKVEGGRIRIGAASDGNSLTLTVRDTGVGLSGAPPSDGTRFGLQQIRERLHALYGDNASLLLGDAPDAEGGTLARITLPLSRKTQEPEAET
ncbi:MAG TPA: histidine kinase [Burkholderiaceae bacterium]|nr:histidine kinase [Burkholderiaceae bacterium]